ncbi:MAG TPA: calcium-binding protein [Nitrosomonas sp.]|nr:calcium-binding protein [Nitrosomonas sp.]
MTFHIFHINEVYSNADGNIQFIEFSGDDDHQQSWEGHSIISTDGNNTHTFLIPHDLPNAATLGKSVLVATKGFADQGFLTPDYVVPNNFLFTQNGTVDIPGMNAETFNYSQLPVDGILSLQADHTTRINSPTDFAGNTATITFNTAIVGSDNADQLMGTEEADVFEAAAGDDTLNGLEGNDVLNGGPGVDTAIFSGALENYSTSRSFLEFSIAGSDGNDTLISVERLQFSDRHIAIDLDEGQSGNNTARLIGAAFDAVAIQSHPDYVGLGLKLFDAGQNMLDVSQFALSAMGNLANETFVDTVYLNVVGIAPSQVDRDFYIGLLEGSGGTLSQAQILEIAASSEVNVANIDLVGLQQSGIEFDPNV